MVNWDYLDPRLTPGLLVCLANLHLSYRQYYHFVFAPRDHQ